MNMKKQVYNIAENGYLQEILVKEFDEEGNCIEELTDNIIITNPPQGLYQAKWTGTEWVEGRTTEEFEQEKLLQDLLPTAEEVQNAELEIKILELLQEVLVI